MADILCVPSLTTLKEGAEGIPVVLMEGMASGLPVVATRCGATEELVHDGLIDERSVDQLADSIELLVKNPELRLAQGKRNRQIVRDSYSEANLTRFNDLLDEVYDSFEGRL
jgi:glycosyltransferase involved in cell wall biosynthesis